MKEPVELKAGDKCPSCGGELEPMLVPTDEQLAAAADKENPQYLHKGYDSAPRDVRERDGALHKCAGCGYRTRFQHRPKSKSKKDDE